MLTTVAKGKFFNAINIANRAINPNEHLKNVDQVSLYNKNYKSIFGYY